MSSYVSTPANLLCGGNTHTHARTHTHKLNARIKKEDFLFLNNLVCLIICEIEYKTCYAMVQLSFYW